MQYKYEMQEELSHQRNSLNEKQTFKIKHFLKSSLLV
jgi:hypothetical protein